MQPKYSLFPRVSKSRKGYNNPQTNGYLFKILSGYVLDSLGNPVPEASVSVNSIVQATDDEGTFWIPLSQGILGAINKLAA